MHTKFKIPWPPLSEKVAHFLTPYQFFCKGHNKECTLTGLYMELVSEKESEQVSKSEFLPINKNITP